MASGGCRQWVPEWNRAGPNNHCTSAILGMDGAVSVSISNIPSKPFCVPAPGSVDIDDGSMNPVLKVEMAELQVFTGVTLDTGVTANRRAFVDNDGVPVAPLPSVDGDGNPVPPPAARNYSAKNRKSCLPEAAVGRAVTTLARSALTPMACQFRQASLRRPEIS